MERLADALVYAVSDINNRPGGRDGLFQDDDVAAPEVWADILGRATDAEKDATGPDGSTPRTSPGPGDLTGRRRTRRERPLSRVVLEAKGWSIGLHGDIR